jgi:hypothetical protein
VLSLDLLHLAQMTTRNADRLFKLANSWKAH